MKPKIAEALAESVRIKEELLRRDAANLEKAIELITLSLKSGGKAMIFGNGGSAADSQHMAAELVGRFKKERKGLSAIALTANTATLTAVANDYSYEASFSRQIEALGRTGDVAIGISTSGKSKNVIEAVKKAGALGIKTVGLLGGDGGSLKGICDVSIVVPSKDTPRIQEAHITVIHIICEAVEDALCL